jgi:adenine-specific DNA-methyltransferase
VTPQTDPEQPKKSYQYDPHIDPSLQWAGKAEHTSFEVPTASLHVHERIDPRTIIRAVQKKNGHGGGSGKLVQRSLFEEPEENPPLREAIEFYKHAHGWTNRLIAGDSLMVMNSLLEKEGMAGKVQMVYIDPPYGIRYGSNFQPFVNNRNVKDGKDSDLTQEPEMLQAFRDTWELGVHSYLQSLRDRALLAKDLLSETGSIFVQIGDQNVHLVRALLDEIFGSQNSCALIAYAKTTTTTGRLLPATADYVLWYAKSLEQVKFHRLYTTKVLGATGATKYDQVELANGSRRAMLPAEKLDPSKLPDGARIFTLDNLTSPRVREARTGYFPITFEKRDYLPNQGEWKTNPEGIKRLMIAKRIHPMSSTLRYVRYLNDFKAVALTNIWTDIGGIQSRSDPKIYVVQTSTTAVERCMLMTTDPGDLVFDPTCGSGTTAYVAEQWGRRWITCDTSRVATALAKQRLMTRVFDYYVLANDREGVAGGFACKRIPRVTLKSIANNPEIREGISRAEVEATIARHAEQETLFDAPEIDPSKARVSGPFTLEAVPAPAVRPITELLVESQPVSLDNQPTLPGVGDLELQPKLQFTEDVSVARFGETIRQRQWRDELLACGIRGKGGQRIQFARLEPLGATRWLQCEGETKGERVERVVVSFGPEHAPLEQRQVELALEEAVQLKPTPKVVIFAAFQFDPEAAKDIDETKWPGVTLLKAQMNTDLLTDDLKKKRSSNESYWLMGQPDVELRKIAKGEHKGECQIEVHGFDYYNPRTGAIESGDTTKIAMWMLDTDYDGRSLYPRQVFFPMAGPKDGWARLAKNLKAEIDEDLIEAYRGTVSLPFDPGDYRRVAVKIVDDRGIESLKIISL